MKRFLFITLCVFSTAFVYTHISAYESPGKPTGFVNDFAGVLSVEQKISLENKIGNFEKTTGAEMAVVTVASLGDETIETYAEKLFEEWGIGKTRADNGVLILVAPNERQVRIEVGYGLEPVVTDAASSGIIRNIILPAFKTGDYYGGINGAVDIVIGLVQGDSEMAAYSEPSSSEAGTDLSSLLGVFLIFAFQLVPVIIYSKSWWLGGIVGLILGFIVFAAVIPALVFALIGLVFDFILSKKFGGKKPPGSGGVWFGGIGGGRGGGGFGGFGGGRSGGGGASGSW